ncbi:MAG: LD-carboxypeptidase [Deltaproteobacteria bacterium]|nr:LD-carboxypeptidase [Deltaproteobacteria bacterium]
MKNSIPLKPVKKIGVCAPSARFDIEKLNTGLHTLQDLGFEVQVPDEIFEKKRYLAGDDILRANIINNFFSDADIDAIICARGGFGAMRTLKYLNWNVIKQNPKPFIGFSDITALLLSIIDRTGNLVIHGPNVVSIAGAGQETIESFYNSITGVFKKISVANGKVIKPGKCAGILKGGNIAVISHLLGTMFQPDFENAVLFLEDIGEPAYKIDRMLTQMKMAGMFEKILGVVTGSFEKCSNDEYIEEILFEMFEEYHIPVLSGLDSGHGKINLSLCMGAGVKMDTAAMEICWN